MKKTALFVLLMTMVLVTASSSFATSVASLKGVYSFQVQGITNQFGYYSGSTWVSVSTCPTTQHCFDQSFPRLTYGTISFDGLGHAKFLTVTNVNGGSGGPTTGTVWAYSVSGFNAAIGTSTNGAYLALGALNSAGVAQTVLFRTAGKNPDTGTAVLQ
jgi:hypothetical protein